MLSLPSLAWALYLAQAFLGLAEGQSSAAYVVASNDTSWQPPRDPNQRIDLAFAAQPNNGQNYTLRNLTGPAAVNLNTLYLSGPLQLANGQIDGVNYTNAIVYIDCDELPGFINLNDVVDYAINSQATAIVFYSPSARQCLPPSNSSSHTGFPWIYTMQSAVDANNLLAWYSSTITGPKAALPTFDILLGIQYSRMLANAQNVSSGSSTSTAIAMVILYAVTGVITLLFLIIIITGAIRAHRHPERYGPRNVLGVGRQSRAKGIARAMLDTIPIVKFSDSRQPKTIDTELGQVSSVEERHDVLVAQDSAYKPESSSQEREVEEKEILDGPGAQELPTDQQELDSGVPNCSICTEDFREGEDLRVLPCDHRFHPACVDPWLLDVSGTCPLCRVDLRPHETENALSDSISGAATSVEGGRQPHGNHATSVEGSELPPPLNPQGGRSRLTAFFRRHPHATTAERIEVLRRHRQERRVGLEQTTGTSEELQQYRSQWQRVRHRFRGV